MKSASPTASVPSVALRRPADRVSWLRLLWVAPLTVLFAVAAVLVFVLFTLFVPRAIFWFRIVAVAALLISWIPDIMLGLGGAPMRLAMRYVGPLTSVGFIGSSQGERPAGPPPGAQTGGPPPAFFSALPMQQVAVLMLLHAAIAVICIGMLTTLPVEAKRSQPGSGDARGALGG